MKNSIVAKALCIFLLSANPLYAEGGSVSTPEIGTTPTNDEVNSTGENTPLPGSSCKDGWALNLLSNPEDLFEVMGIIAVHDSFKKQEESGLYKVQCSRNPVVAQTAISSGLIDSLGSRGGAQAIGEYLCENQRELAFARMPNTTACNAAANAMRETGLGSPILGIPAVAERQIEIIDNIINNPSVATDGNLAVITGVILAAGYVTKIITDTVVEHYVEKSLDQFDSHIGGTEGTDSRQEYREALHQLNVANEELAQAEKELQQYREDHPRQTNEPPTQSELNREAAVDDASTESNNAENVVKKIGLGECKTVTDCDGRIPPQGLPDSCPSYTCVENAINAAFSKADELIAQCEASGPLVSSATDNPLISERQTGLLAQLYGSCKPVLVEDPCLAMGDSEPCLPPAPTIDANNFDVLDVLYADIVNEISCRPNDLQCEIVLKTKRNIPLSRTEQLLLETECSGTLPSKYLSLSVEQSVTSTVVEQSTFTDCIYFHGNQICGEESVCHQQLYQKQYITSVSAQNFFDDFPNCGQYASVNTLLAERIGRLLLGGGETRFVPLTRNDMTDESEESTRSLVLGTGSVAIVPKQPEIGSAAELQMRGFAFMSRQPTLSVLLGNGTSEDFRQAMCGD